MTERKDIRHTSLCFVAMGSNQGDSVETLVHAADQLNALGSDFKFSHLYCSAPLYRLNQNAFINAAVSFHTQLGPIQLLKSLQEIELAFGRNRQERYGPRTLDLDLLLYGKLDFQFTSGHEILLAIPHPRMMERRFVLEPLRDLGLEFSLNEVSDQICERIPNSCVWNDLLAELQQTSANNRHY